MADRFEKAMPEFWKKVGTKSFEVTGAISLSLFIALNSDINGLRSQVTDLNRYSLELVPKDERDHRDQQLELRRQAVRQVIEKNLKEWRETTLRIEQANEQLTEDRDHSFQSIENALGDVRVRLAALESLPDETARPEKANAASPARKTGQPPIPGSVARPYYPGLK